MVDYQKLNSNMACQQYLVFDVRRPGGMRRYQEILKMLLIVVGCLSVGLHIAVLFRSTFDVPCLTVQTDSREPPWIGLTSSESRKSSSDQLTAFKHADKPGRPVLRSPLAHRRRPAFVGMKLAQLTSSHVLPPDVPLNDAVKRQKKNYEVLWRHYRATANISNSPYARPRQPIPAYQNMAAVFSANKRQKNSLLADSVHVTSQICWSVQAFLIKFDS